MAHVKGDEYFYQSILYTMLKLVGADIVVEDLTNVGRIDITIQTPSHVYLLELKSRSSAKEALQQILDNRYYEKFLSTHKKIVLIGLSIDLEKRNLGQWIVKEL